MSTGWTLFVTLGTLLTLGALTVLLWRTWRRPAAVDAHGEPVTTGHVYDGIEEEDRALPGWWTAMFAGSIVFALGYMLWYGGFGAIEGIGGWSSHGEHAARTQAAEERHAPLRRELAALPPAEFAQDPRAVQFGRRLFINQCSTCHGAIGAGAFGFPDLGDGEWQWGGDPDRILATIRDGRIAVMTGWLDVLGERGVQDSAHYVRSQADLDHDPEAAARGAQHYAAYCVACHGPDGTGNPLLGAPDLTNEAWLYGNELEQIAFTIRHGRTGVMPAFGQVLDADRLAILARYVGSLAEQRMQRGSGE